MNVTVEDLLRESAQRLRAAVRLAAEQDFASEFLHDATAVLQDLERL